MLNPGRELGILDLLNLQGFDLTSRFKLVRHQEAGTDLHDLLRRGWLEAYQSFQHRPVFNNVDFIVSFIGVGGTEARLVGVYKVIGRKPGSAGRIPEGCPHRHWLDCENFYGMQRVAGFEEIEHRVIIEWGKGTRRWDQWPTNKPVDGQGNVRVSGVFAPASGRLILAADNVNLPPGGELVTPVVDTADCRSLVAFLDVTARHGVSFASANS